MTATLFILFGRLLSKLFYEHKNIFISLHFSGHEYGSNQAGRSLIKSWSLVRLQLKCQAGLVILSIVGGSSCKGVHSHALVTSLAFGRRLSSSDSPF